MTELAILLLRIFVAFTVLAFGACVGAWWYYRTKRGIDLDAEFEGRYDYHGQAIYNQQGEIEGYELLLRELDPATGEWRLPAHVLDFPLLRIVAEIQRLVPHLEDNVEFITINLTLKQILDFRSDQFIAWTQSILAGRRLDIELDALEIIGCNFIQRWRLKKRLRAITARNIPIVIEGVDSTRLMYRRLLPFLERVTHVKFVANAFNKSATHWIEVTLGEWQVATQKAQVGMILGKIERLCQEQLADQLHIPYRQGYLYARPEKIEREDH